MTINNKPSVPNLTARLKTAFRDAYDYASAQYAIRDDGGEERIYLILAREFAAGFSLLDTMVQHDRFCTLGDLKHATNALLRYREMLVEGAYELQSREITELLRAISAVEATEFAS